MIINSHVHLNTNNNFFFYNDYTLGSFLGEMALSKIDVAFPCINPKVELYRCPNDCSIHCKKTASFKDLAYSSSINSNLQYCPCSSPNRHRVVLVSRENDAILKCRTCGKTIFKGSIDPLRQYNLELIYITRPYRSILKPILYISLCKSTIQNEIDYFEKNYPNDFIGFKFHPWNDQVNVKDFHIRSNHTILIHCGSRIIEHSSNSIIFAKQNPNVKIIISHAAALCDESLRQISFMDNIFIDCCPSTFLFKTKKQSLENYKEIHSPEDIYYKVLDFVPSNKILFGSDSPWGNSINELKIVNNLKVSKRVKEQILFMNAIRAYEL